MVELITLGNIDSQARGCEDNEDCEYLNDVVDTSGSREIGREEANDDCPEGE
jgi:hypothetical protein